MVQRCIIEPEQGVHMWRSTVLELCSNVAVQESVAMEWRFWCVALEKAEESPDRDQLEDKIALISNTNITSHYIVAIIREVFDSNRIIMFYIPPDPKVSMPIIRCA